jgi:exosortase
MLERPESQTGSSRAPPRPQSLSDSATGDLCVNISTSAEAHSERRSPLPPLSRFCSDPANTLAVGVLVLLFGLLTWHLLFFWEVNPQYSYGWVVPGLAIYLFLRRWEPRPRPQTPPRWAALALIFSLFVLAPIWLVREATPDWSVVSWLFAVTIVSSLLLVLCRLGGPAWLIHFAFPVCFILTAVPWPQRLELTVVQGLMRFVADAASEILNWIGIPALATGNLVRLPGGSVAIDEACSGIRSLQAMLMISLFLGELRNLNLIRRAVLAAFAVIAAIILNLARTAGLVFLFAREGASAFNRWHTPTGNALFFAGLILLSGLAFLFRPGRMRSDQTAISQPSLKIRSLPPLASAAILLWVAAIVGATELWYASNENKTPRVTLEINWPEIFSGYKELPVPESVRQVLLSSSGRMATWQDGCQWALFAFSWRPGRTATQSARMHRPDTCLQASGALLDRELEPITATVGPANLRFNTYLFHLGGQPLFVFFTIWEEANLDATSRKLGQDWSGWSRVQRAFARERNLGQQSLEFVLSSSENYDDAVRLLKRRLPELIHCRDVEAP